MRRFAALAGLWIALAACIPWRAQAATGFHDLGHAPAGTPVLIAVTLAYEHQSELDALVREQSDPGSALFHRYLSNAQFDAYFAPAPSRYAQVMRALRRGGFRVVQTFPNRTVIDAVAPSAAAERFFSTEIHLGVQDGHGVRYANVRPATVPAALRGLVVAVTGLDDLIRFQTRLDAAGGPVSGDGPADFQHAYEEPVLHGYDGEGRAIANTMAGNVSDADLRAYARHFKVEFKHKVIHVAVDGGNATLDPESALDVEAMNGTSPGAQVYFYSFPEFRNVYAEDTYNRVVSDDLVDAANSSWGGCEDDPAQPLGTAFSLASNAIFEQGAAEGITFPIATGDYGWTTCSRRGIVDETSADSDPYALAVGGTILTSSPTGAFVSETGWRGSEGGVSLIFGLPPYQSGVPNVLSKGRNIPDIALSAGAMAIRWNGRWAVVGGTSEASPLWTGLESQIDQYLGSRIGFVNPRFYQLLQGPSYHSVFRDITTGSNGYPALPGFDRVTGIGAPLGWPLAHAKP